MTDVNVAVDADGADAEQGADAPGEADTSHELAHSWAAGKPMPA